ncbi:MAG: 16S rRNA (guanine(527)-N(7))-methyltransferase RsmG [Acetobacteraceae bacterium]|nr:16S rRNA (guanine(527)-N(7))-methyltransferase RsmG [Acetobacteraceae bacterium]
MSSREALERFVTLLLRWNRTINLVSRGDESAIWERHIADSLQLAPLFPPGAARGIDLGSGGGFPGLVLAHATGVLFDLIEADQRKAAFLREAARLLEAPARVHAARIEDAPIPPAPVVTARALAGLPRLLELAAPKLEVGGVGLFLKGATGFDELTDARREWHMRVEQTPSRTAPGAVIYRISELRRVPRSA